MTVMWLEALLDAGRAAHGAGAPAAHVLVRRLVDERRLDEERVEVDAGALGPGVGDGALDDLLEDGGAALLGELEELQRLAGLTAPDEVDDNAGFARAEPREAGNRLADHGSRNLSTSSYLPTNPRNCRLCRKRCEKAWLVSRPAVREKRHKDRGRGRYDRLDETEFTPSGAQGAARGGVHYAPATDWQGKKRGEGRKRGGAGRTQLEEEGNGKGGG